MVAIPSIQALAMACFAFSSRHQNHLRHPQPRVVPQVVQPFGIKTEASHFGRLAPVLATPKDTNILPEEEFCQRLSPKDQEKLIKALKAMSDSWSDEEQKAALEPILTSLFESMSHEEQLHFAQLVADIPITQLLAQMSPKDRRAIEPIVQDFQLDDEGKAKPLEILEELLRQAFWIVLIALATPWGILYYILNPIFHIVLVYVPVMFVL